MFGKEATEEMWVAEIDAPRRTVVKAHSSGTDYTTTFTLTAAGPGTDLTMAFSAAVGSSSLGDEGDDGGVRWHRHEGDDEGDGHRSRRHRRTRRGGRALTYPVTVVASRRICSWNAAPRRAKAPGVQPCQRRKARLNAASER